MNPCQRVLELNSRITPCREPALASTAFGPVLHLHLKQVIPFVILAVICGLDIYLG